MSTKRIKIALIFLVAFVFSYILDRAGMILPYLFGAIVIGSIFGRFVYKDLSYPKFLGSIGLFIIGVEIGSTFTRTTLIEMLSDSMNIIIVTFLVIIFSLLLSRIFMYLSSCTQETALLSSIPGALSQMLVMAETNKNADLLLVTLTQMSRIILVVIIIPFIVRFSDDFPQVQSVESIINLLSLHPIYIIIIVLGAVVLIQLLKKVNFTVPILMGPIIFITMWNFATDITFSVDLSLMYIAQILFGVRMGLQISNLFIRLSMKLIMIILLQNLLLIFGTFVIVYIVQLFTSHSFNNLFLSAAPGGIGQIIIVAREINANIAMISTYHIFRIFFILFVVTPIIDYYLKKQTRKGSVAKLEKV